MRRCMAIGRFAGVSAVPTGLTHCHICTGTGLDPSHICAGTALDPSHICAGTVVQASVPFRVAFVVFPTGIDRAVRDTCCMVAGRST